jgi:hypothetical protein
MVRVNAASAGNGGGMARDKHSAYGQTKLVPVSFARPILPGTFGVRRPSPPASAPRASGGSATAGITIY